MLCGLTFRQATYWAVMPCSIAQYTLAAFGQVGADVKATDPEGAELTAKVEDRREEERSCG
ncbi:MAG: hypothetical protein AUK47_14430 [Deltaproteobacteria bacterium CG2_30_63_29]|nr:MAG: hypothetical protein AUK47_14430 [Deltaproteobacteria bacterium CG2_30_63_29]PIW01389.1 MAG: hypothetical protein COW42_05145 [Deltaproteobacteria bacterium CG17_big_fil_post_rev_8_21_14_2_50_63_7]